MSRKAKQRFWLACCSVLYQCIEHADDTIVSFGNKVCFESWNYCAGRSGEKHSTISCFFPHFFRALASFCVYYNRTEHSQGFSICNCYAHFLFVCRIYTGVFWSRMKQNEEKNRQIIVAIGDRRHLNYVNNSMYTGKTRRSYRCSSTFRVLHISMNACWHMNQLFYSSAVLLSRYEVLAKFWECSRS